VFSQASQAQAVATLEQLISGNPKVIGAMKALVETVRGSVEDPGEDVPETVEAPVSRSLTRAFSSGGGI
jgi:hypothetical protein